MRPISDVSVRGVAGQACKAEQTDHLRPVAVLLPAVRKDDSRPPVIFLSDPMNETAVDEVLKAGTGDLAPTLGVD